MNLEEQASYLGLCAVLALKMTTIDYFRVARNESAEMLALVPGAVVVTRT